MRVVAFTHILLSSDLGHLGEWLRHQQRLGMEEVHISYDTRARDSRCGVLPDGRWAKKPNAPLPTSDVPEQRRELWKIIEPYQHHLPLQIGEKQMKVIVTECSIDDPRLHKRQIKAFNRYLGQLKSRHFDWVAFFDIDELLWAPGPRPLETFLGGVPPVVASVRVKQMLMGERFEDGKSIRMRSITKCYGRVKGIYKGIYRIKSVDRLKSVHCIAKMEGRKMKPYSNEICYFHFRGVPSRELLSERAWKLGCRYAPYAERETYEERRHLL